MLLQQFKHALVIFLYWQQQERGAAIVVFHFDVGTLANKILHNLFVALVSRIVEDRPTALIFHIEFSSMVDEKLDHVLVIVPNSIV